jgi:hypothetical protein
MKFGSLVNAALLGAGAWLVTSAGFPAVGHATVASVSFALTSDHCTGGCLDSTDPVAGSVTITDIATDKVSVTVDLAAGFKFVHTGLDADFGFNLSTLTVESFASILLNGVAGQFSTIGGNPESVASLHMDGAGFFGFGVACTPCGPGASNAKAGPLTFVVSEPGETVSNFIQNATGQFFAVDVIAPNGNTGAVDASLLAVPGPIAGAGLPGLLAACGGLIALARRRRRLICPEFNA